PWVRGGGGQGAWSRCRPGRAVCRGQPAAQPDRGSAMPRGRPVVRPPPAPPAPPAPGRAAAAAGGGGIGRGRRGRRQGTGGAGLRVTVRAGRAVGDAASVSVLR